MDKDFLSNYNDIKTKTFIKVYKEKKTLTIYTKGIFVEIERICQRKN